MAKPPSQPKPTAAKPITHQAIREIADAYAGAEQVPSSEVIGGLAKGSGKTEQAVKDIFDDVWAQRGHEGSLFGPPPGPIRG